MGGDGGEGALCTFPAPFALGAFRAFGTGLARLRLTLTLTLTLTFGTGLSRALQGAAVPAARGTGIGGTGEGQAAQA